MTSKEGVRTMERIVQAPVRGLVVVEVSLKRLGKA